MHDHPGVPACLVNRVYAYGTGGPLSIAGDKAVLKYFTSQFERSGFRLPDLLKDIALSEAFSTVREAPAASQKVARSATAGPAAGAG